MGLLQGVVVWTIFIFPCAFSMQWRLGESAKVECAYSGPKHIKSAYVPIMGISKSSIASDVQVLNSVELTEDIGAYLLLGRKQCEHFGFLANQGKLVRSKETNHIMEAHNGMLVVFPDINSQGTSVRTEVRVICDNEYYDKPKMGLAVLAKKFELYVKEDGAVYCQIAQNQEERPEVVVEIRV